MIRVKKSYTSLSILKKEDDGGYVQMTPSERVAFIWELTAEIWALKDKINVKRRLQRHITNFIKK